MNRKRYSHQGELELKDLAEAFPEGDRSNYFSQNYRSVDYKGSFDIGDIRVRLAIQNGKSYVSLQPLESADSEASDKGVEKRVAAVLSGLEKKFPKLEKLVSSGGGPGFGHVSIPVIKK